jgi:transposase-like protein
MSVMHHTHFPVSSSLTMINRPRCPNCQISMMLVGIESSLAGPDLRTFECPKCELAYKALAEDPIKSNKAAGWLRSELRPPE